MWLSLLVMLVIFAMAYWLWRRYYCVPGGLEDVIKVLSRQSARWSLAAEQDQSPLVALLHANYGAAYLWALKDVASSEQVRKTTGLDLTELERKITRVQDEATKRVANLCPEFVGSADSFLATVAGHA